VGLRPVLTLNGRREQRKPALADIWLADAPTRLLLGPVALSETIPYCPERRLSAVAHVEFA
jgi:hypothetical protein